MKLVAGLKAIDFELPQIDGELFKLSQYKGSKILLSFFRNGACAMCNLRVHEMIKQHHLFKKSGVKIVAVFESTIEEMAPFVGQQKPPFALLADPEGKVYSRYGVESSEEMINYIVQHKIAVERIKEAADAGFPLTKQAGGNFYRLPADFLIDHDFKLQKVYYSNHIIDHMSIEEVIGESSQWS